MGAIPDLEPLFAVVAEERGIDFRDYRRETIWRGVSTRLEARGFHSVARYAEAVRADRAELDKLLGVIVVAVTAFFRDPDAFANLARVVLPALFASGRGLLRAWSVGVATGEEAWSLAMLLAEADTEGRGFEILATDVSPCALAEAERAWYPEARLRPTPPHLRRRYLAPWGEGAVVGDELRARVRFALHDVVGPVLAPPDAVVATFDLILFRNVLIHFDRRLQENAFARVGSALPADGAMFLGRYESPPSVFRERFPPWGGCGAEAHIFRRADLW